MKLFFLTTLLCYFWVAMPVRAQKAKPVNKTIDHIEKKYRQIDAKAEYVMANDVPVAKQTRFIQPEDGVPNYDTLRQIALIRHGEPDINKTGKFSFEEAQKYVAKYDSVGIIVPNEPFFEIKEPEKVALFTSSITRAQATASYLFGDSTNINIPPDFREFETHMGKGESKFRLPIKLWTTGARIKWMLGMGRHGIESVAEARKRAKGAAGLLAKATEEKPKVVLVAHGFLNRNIKENLQQMGWRVVKDGGSNYFATTVLVKMEPDKI